ncbi:MAG: hypothetical protein H6744_11960 [Deltaproteobacteria bacterium]|nr:hypothetical protein [Deltaproteobacteria bacterium]MCB9787386.1 hypothetical protein [Deltaproteobacteria bacterium]
MTFTPDTWTARMTRSLHKARILALATLSMSALAAASFGGCASPDTIDRVQPNLLDKSMFSGEWYLLDTVVKAPFASAYAFKGVQSDLLRGTWEIEQDYLYFYRTYEFVDGVESQGIKSDTDTPLLDEDGNPVTFQKQLPDGTTVTATRYVFRSSPLARFPISEHVDVRRSYNTLTGEESNVIVEDSDEKFWWERKSMRVDFGKDSGGSQARISGQFSLGSVYEGEVGPDEIKLRVLEGGDYIDFVVKAWLTAPSVYFSGFGWVPTCLFYPWYTGGYYECNTEELQIRTAFMRVPQENSYQPFDYNDQMLGKFGFFRAERADYDTYYGITYKDAARQIQRFRIWDEYVTGADGRLDYSQMTPKPIVYYLSPDYPRELVPGALDLADQWNQPFVETVRALKDPSFNGRMFVLCENTTAEAEAARAADPNALIAETDPSICKDMDKPRYLGDLRYNMLVSVNEPTQVGLYGYGPAHSDPLTGETVVAYAWMYTANIRQGAQTAMDMIEYEAGVQSFRDITQAGNITQKIKAGTIQHNQNGPRSLTMEQALTAASTVMEPGVAETLSTVGLPSTDTNLAQAALARLDGTTEYDALLWKNAEMAAVAGLPVENLDKVEDPDGFLRSIVHPTSMATEDFILWKQQQDVSLGRQAICMGEQFDDTFRGLGLEYKSEYDKAVCDGLAGATDLTFDFSAFNEPGASCASSDSVCTGKQVCTALEQGEVSGKYCMTPCNVGDLLDQLRKQIRQVNAIDPGDYWDPNALYSDVKDDRVRRSQLAVREIIEQVRDRIFIETQDRMWSTVALHEVGHNMGLRHNFASSTDALNYFPDYWALKGFVGSDGQYHAKNLWQRDTNDQVVSRIREYQQNSVMEYGSGFNARYRGLGAYDHAAIHFGYGGLLHVFAQPPDMAELEAEGYLSEPEDDDPSNYPVTNVGRELPLARAFRKIHHTNYPNVFGSVAAMEDRTMVPWQDLIATGADGQPKECSFLDNAYKSSVCGESGSYCQAFPTGFFCTKPGMVEVPYRFCSDEYNSASPTCQTRDEGADGFEIVMNSMDDYEAYWPFVAYKRDSDLFDPAGTYYSWVFGQELQWRKHFEHWAYNYARYNRDGWWEKKFGVPWHMDVNGGLGDTLAAQEIFTKMANIFGRPSDAYYAWNVQDGQYEPAVGNGKNQYCNFIQIREDVGGRPIYPGYDFDGYLYTPARAGTFYDRLIALQVMTYPQMIFVRGADTTSSIQRFRLNFADVWPQRMQNLFSSLLTSEPVGMGWCLEHEGGPAPTLANGCAGSGTPVRIKERKWFGTPEELDAYYANCEPVQPEPEYSFPTTQFRLPALAMLYGITWMSRNFDRTFVDRTRLWLKGDGSEVAMGPDFEVVEYADPLSGKIYRAAYDPAETDPFAKLTPREMVPDAAVEPHGNLYWPSARLLALANQRKPEALGDNYHFSELQQLVGRLEIIRGLYRRFDFDF